LDQVELIKVAHALADAAREQTLKYFRTSNLGTENKLDTGFDPVTVADKAAEEAMRAVLAEMRPDDGILGEEFGNKASTTGLTWVLDPIDGTRGYMSGTPTWGTLIAVHDGTKPVLGIIDQPYIGERFIGGFGKASMVRGIQQIELKVSDTKNISDAVILSTFPEVGDASEHDGFHALAKQTKLTRYGMDCYGYALLAGGHVDLVVEAGLQAYDIQAPIAVIEAAGGVITNWTGGPVDQGGRSLAAATPELHAAAMKELSGYV
jgi:histidinol phosphatase-like enzyme (inositol monophosphatase family)